MQCQKREGSGRAEVSAFFLCCTVCEYERKELKNENEVKCFGGKRGTGKSKNNEISIEEAEKYFKKSRLRRWDMRSLIPIVKSEAGFQR